MPETTCPACGQQVPDAAFCSRCGAALGSGAPGAGPASPSTRRGAAIVAAAVAALVALIGGGVVYALAAGGDEAGTAATGTTPAETPVYEVPTSAPEPSPEPVETLEPLPETPSCAEERIEFDVVEQGFTYYVEHDQGQVSYAVVLRNPSATCATSDVNVDVDLLDAAGDVLSTETVPLGTVPPGGTTALADTTFLDERPARIEFGGQAATGEEPPTGGITASNLRQTKSSFGSDVTGRLRSTLDEPVSARVAVVVRRNGKVVGGVFTYKSLPHNGTGGFEASTLVELPTGVLTAYVTW